MTLVLIVVLLLGNAFFVAAQISCIAVRRDQIEPLARAGDRRARVSLNALRDIPMMLAGTQLGIALCSLGLGAVAEPGVASLLEDGFHALSLPDALLHPISFAIALGIVSFCHMVLGEMVPKNISLAGPVRVTLLLSLPFSMWVRVTRPLLRLISALADGVLRIVGVQPQAEASGAYTSAELADVIHHSAAEGMLDPEDMQRLDRALQFDAHTVREVAIPVEDLVTAKETTTVYELEDLVARTGFSRFPIVADADPSTVLGYLHIKDTLAIPESRLDTPIASRLRRPMIAIEADCPLLEACTKLQRAGTHLGRVTDGSGTVGIIALEDILETLVGTVHDASHTAA
ncbi:MAG TPA: hemolysin family protein [Mycobacteriales bacterium]|nr:hemolysin family protein [Mycobacteriales bacterium]